MTAGLGGTASEATQHERDSTMNKQEIEEPVYTVIKNKVYNTGTAKFIGRYTAPNKDGKAVIETLYRKKNGEYFIHRAATPWTGKDRIIPLSYDDAVQWGKMSLCDLDFNKAFTGAVRGEGVVKVTLSSEARALLEQEQSASGRTYNDIIEQLVKDGLPANACKKP
jgi:hypothetical protein